uniref:Uncharacterized protein n=1 Tax=Cacopsylla melanoneura TaxID=428564 RepID=A0A8D9DSD9_9HEMI
MFLTLSSKENIPQFGNGAIQFECSRDICSCATLTMACTCLRTSICLLTGNLSNIFAMLKKNKSFSFNFITDSAALRRSSFPTLVSGRSWDDWNVLVWCFPFTNCSSLLSFNAFTLTILM